MNQYQKMLKYVDQYIFISDHRHAAQIRLMVESGDLKLILSEIGSCDFNHNKDIVNFMDSESTVTYSDCIDLVLKPENERLELLVYDGDSYDGSRTYLRCTYTFVGSWHKYSPLVDALKVEFESKTMRKILEDENKAREAKRIVWANKILNAGN